MMGTGGYDENAHLHNLLNEKSSPNEKREALDANVCPCLNVGVVDYRHGVRHVRTHDESSYHIAGS